MNAPAWTVIGPPVRGRSCGGCQLCCELLPIRGLKPAAQKCKHQCSRGCAIYPDRPRDCRAFSCKWLTDASTAELRRPDKTGYVIDPMPDTILVEGVPVDAVQIWVDRARPDAHRDPALRAWLEHVAETFGMPALIRYDETAGFALFAPVLTGGDWREIGTENVLAEDDARALRLGMFERMSPSTQGDQL